MQNSIEGRERRIGAMVLLRSTAKHSLTRFAVSHNRVVALAGDIQVAAPVTPITLNTAVLVLLASIKPYLNVFPLFIGVGRGPQH